MNNKENNNRPYGQPYYDENGVFHSGLDDEESTDKQYEEAYRRQLEEYERISGENFDGEDFSNQPPEFIPYKDRYKYAEQNVSAQNNGNSSAANNNTAQKRTNNSTQRKNSTNQKSHTGQKNGTRPRNSARKKNSQSKNPARKNSKNSTSANCTNPVRNTNKKSKGKSKKMHKKRHPVKTFIKVFLTLIIVLVVILNVVLINYLGNVNKIEKGERTITNGAIASSDVRNVLVIGSDSRSPKDRGRTDTIILLSINKNTKQITMTSFMRDMYVNIKGKNDKGENVDTWGKINSAYVYGGAELLMDTLEQNFDIQIDDYVYFGFESFIDIVNSVGGVEITVTDEEAQGMQPQTMEINDILKREHTKDVLTKGGKYTMNGYQALAYARLRYVGNADFQRTERQREVVNKIIEKVKANPLTINKLGTTASKSISTNMTTGELYILFYKCLFSMGYEIKNLRLPADNQFSYGSHDGQSTLDPDFNACKQQIKEHIYSGISDED